MEYATALAQSALDRTSTGRGGKLQAEDVLFVVRKVTGPALLTQMSAGASACEKSRCRWPGMHAQGAAVPEAVSLHAGHLQGATAELGQPYTGATALQTARLTASAGLRQNTRRADCY